MNTPSSTRRLARRSFGIAILLLGLAEPARATNAGLYEVPDLFPPTEQVLEGILREIRQTPQNLPPLAVDPVATPLGEPLMEVVDLAGGGAGPGIGFARYHAGFVADYAQFWGFFLPTHFPQGIDWTHNYHYLLRRQSEISVIIYYQRGKVLVFDKVDGAAGLVWQYNPSPFGNIHYRGVPYQLVETGTKLELMDPRNQQILTFEFGSLSNGQVRGVERIRDATATPSSSATTQMACSSPPRICWAEAFPSTT